MKKNYAKIDRATGKVLKQKSSEGMERVFNKPSVWIPLEQTNQPPYDLKTHKLVQEVTQPDLSDLNVDVLPGAKRVEGYTVVALTAQELQKRLEQELITTSNQLFKAVELLYEWIAGNGGVAPSRSDFPNGLWTKLNARRALRGENTI